MRNKVLQAQLDRVPFILRPNVMDSLLTMANSDTPRSEMHTTPKVANESVTYEKRGTVAIISVDGGMYKKDIGGLCSSVASYDKIIKMVDRAEKDTEIETVLYRVDSPGGALAGADEAEDRIYNSNKKTITFYENEGASGAIWVFAASDELYASEATMLGSIGVVVSYLGEDKKNKRVEIVSKRAANKRCSLNGDCKEKISNVIDVYEDMFYARVTKNTGFSAEKIESVFNNGGMIFAKEAKDSGFIKEVITFDSLLKSLEATPTASGDKSKKIKTGADMAFIFDRENLDETEQTFNALAANKTTLEGRNSRLALELETASTALEAKEKEFVDLQASFDSKLSEAVINFKTEAETRMREAFSVGVDVDVAVAMLGAETAKDASALAIKAKESGGATLQESELEKEKKEQADLDAKCAKLGLVLVTS